MKNTCEINVLLAKICKIMLLLGNYLEGLMNLMLFEDLMTRLGLLNVQVGLVLASLGLATALLAKRIARWVRQTREIEPSDKVLLTCKAFGLVMICAALILMIIE